MTAYRVWYSPTQWVAYTMLEDALRVAKDIFKKTGVVAKVTSYD